MYKKILIISFLVLFLSSCFWWDDNSVDSSVQTKFENDNFSINIPSSWEIIKNTDSILPKPANWEIIFDAASKTKNDNFYRNILVLKQNLDSSIESFDFIVWNYLWSKDEYYYFKEISEKNVLIDSKKTKIYNFEARYSEDTPIFKFIQTWIVCDKEWYLITLALEKNNINLERYEWLLASFECREEINEEDKK